MRVLVSDVNSSHANSMKDIILAECPSAEVIVRIESLSQSVMWAAANDVDIISRSTTGLSDYRNETDGDTAYGHGIGIVHAHGSNSHEEMGPTQLDRIVAVSCGDASGNNGSYGDGLEFYTSDSTQSAATARVAGIIAQLLVDHPTWEFNDARMALRQTASKWPNWTKEDGFGLIDKDAANAVTDPAIGWPVRFSLDVNESTGILTASWKNFYFGQSDIYLSHISIGPVQGASHYFPDNLIWSGTDQAISLEWKHGGARYFVVQHKRNDKYSPIFKENNVFKIIRGLDMDQFDKSGIASGQKIYPQHIRDLYDLLEGNIVNKQSVVTGGRALFNAMQGRERLTAIARACEIVPVSPELVNDGGGWDSMTVFSSGHTSSGDDEWVIYLSWSLDRYIIGQNGEMLVFIRDYEDGFTCGFNGLIDVSYPSGIPIKINQDYSQCVRYLKWFENHPDPSYIEYADPVNETGEFYSHPFDDWWFKRSYNGTDPIFGWTPGIPNVKKNDGGLTGSTVLIGGKYVADYNGSGPAVVFKIEDKQGIDYDDVQAINLNFGIGFLVKKVIQF